MSLMQSHSVKGKGAVIQATLVLFGTFGIIVPLAVWLLPSTGRFPQKSALLYEGEQSIVMRPPKSQLSFYIRGLNHLSQTDKRQLHPHQFRRLTTVISPWLRRATMTDNEAQKLKQKLATILTPEQQELMHQWQASLGGYGPPPVSNDWQGRSIQEFRDTYNPFYPPAKHRLFSAIPPEMQERYQMRYGERMAMLKQWRDSLKAQVPKTSSAKPR